VALLVLYCLNHFSLHITKPSGVPKDKTRLSLYAFEGKLFFARSEATMST
jgi:hypothetical protein